MSIEWHWTANSRVGVRMTTRVLGIYGELKSKMKTLKVFVPADQPDYRQAAARFKKNMGRYEQILKVSEGMNLRSFKVTTALGPILKFYIGDAMKFIQAHNLRHAQQIRNILSAVQEPAIT